MQLKKCDHCGKIYRSKKSFYLSKWVSGRVGDICFDLCSKCAPKFINYAKKYLKTKSKKRR